MPVLRCKRKKKVLAKQLYRLAIIYVELREVFKEEEK